MSGARFKDGDGPAATAKESTPSEPAAWREDDPDDPDSRADDSGDPDDDPWSQRLTRARAREILSARFRTAGLALVRGYRLSEGDLSVTLDGYDASRRIGYAFVTGEDRDDASGIDSEAERKISQLSSAGKWRILVVRDSDVPSAEALERLIDAFFATMPR